jgi:hypothetical protein
MTRDDPAAFAPPPAFGPFRVLHQIGIGALGPVFRTYEPARDRLVAVKVFRLDVTPEQARTLADELARAADAGLFHPSIVEPIAAGVEGTVAYRAEEYVAAESLDVAIRHYAPAALDTALPFLTQLAGAIDFARSAGVGHGALHLRDVFVTPDEARASGFGIVEALERTGLRAPVRRPYSAPERIAGSPWSTPADVFSLAAIAYELLTGRRPSGTGEQIAPLTGSNIGPYADVIRSVLARAMDEDPDRRYSTALGFASALEVAAHSGAVTDGGIAMSGRASSAAVAPLAPAPRQDPAGPHSALPVGVPVDTVDDPAPATAAPVEDDDAGDDVAAERDADTAHHLLLREQEESAAPTLFDGAGPEGPEVDQGDEDERLADLAMEEPAAVPIDSRWHYDQRTQSGVATRDDLRTPGQAQVRSSRPVIEPGVLRGTVEAPRPAMLPLALALVLGLLLGFAAGYAAGGRGVTPTGNPAPTAAAVPPPGSGKQPAPAPASGRAYSEQAVEPRGPSTPPANGEVPPVPGDAPSPALSAGGVSPAAPALGPTGRLVIRSTPPGAAVTVNGKWRGRTPLTMDALQFGPYAVRLVQPGYTVAREDVTLSAADPARTLSFGMQREPTATTRGRSSGRATAESEPRRPSVSRSPFFGTIYVDSLPRGARVLIDGRQMGTTPASIPDLAIGSHVVRLELADHRAWTTSTRVTAGQETRVRGSLERIR